MGAKVSAEMKHALQLVKAGLPVYEAATKAGIYPSSLYKALKEQRKKHKKHNA